MSGAQPNVTLYVSNLDSKVKKDEVRRTLYALFSSYGKVLDVVQKRDHRTRGTAFVVFRDLASSTAALRGLDGEAYYGNQLRVSYAKSMSHATVALTEGPEAVYQIKLGLRTVDGKKLDANKSKLTVSGAQQKLIEQRNKAKRARADEEDEDEEEQDSEDEEDASQRADGERDKKKGKMDDDEMEMEEDSDDDTAQATASMGAPQPSVGDIPNPILFVRGLPAEVTQEMLLPLFQQYPGLVSLKLLPLLPNSPSNSGTAFVNYESTSHAQTAKEALNDFLLAPQVPMKVNWAQRQ
ncbi:hypothetical protein OIO90_002442 [Microbotryomycetes sp. JL221]|nr:hypothetical protein OIO90_002442 [Microbotryomycetes sp. JL221]